MDHGLDARAHRVETGLGNLGLPDHCSQQPAPGRAGTELGGGCGGRARLHRQEVGGQEGQGGLTGWRERLESETGLRPDSGERGGEPGPPRPSPKTASWHSILAAAPGAQSRAPGSPPFLSDPLCSPGGWGSLPSPLPTPRSSLLLAGGPTHARSSRSPIWALHRRHGLPSTWTLSAAPGDPGLHWPPPLPLCPPWPPLQAWAQPHASSGQSTSLNPCRGLSHLCYPCRNVLSAATSYASFKTRFRWNEL